MNKNNILTIVVGGLLCAFFIFFGIREYKNQSAKYVDAEHKIEFNIDSCSTFIRCLGTDIKTNKKDWETFYEQGFDLNMTDLQRTKKRIYYNSMIPEGSIGFVNGGSPVTTTRGGFINNNIEVAKLTDYDRYDYRYNATDSKPKSIKYCVFILGKDSIELYDKQDGSTEKDVSDKNLILNQHEAFYAQRLYEQLIDNYAAKKAELEKIEREKANKLAAEQKRLQDKQERIVAQIQDSIRMTDMNKFHKEYFPNCK